MNKLSGDYGFSDPECEVEVGENTLDIFDDSEYVTASTGLRTTSDCVSSRPRLVTHRQGDTDGLPYSNREEVVMSTNKRNKDLPEKKKMVNVIDIE